MKMEDHKTRSTRFTLLQHRSKSALDYHWKNENPHNAVWAYVFSKTSLDWNTVNRASRVAFVWE